MFKCLCMTTVIDYWCSLVYISKANVNLGHAFYLVVIIVSVASGGPQDDGPI